MDTPEKIVQVYHANEEAFNCAAKVLLGFKGAHLSPYQEEMLSDPYVVKEIDGVFIEAENLLTDLDYQNLYDAFAPLIESCRFREAGTYDSQVVFVLESNYFGDAAVLLYFLNEDVAANYMIYTKTAIMITPHWIAEIEVD